MTFVHFWDMYSGGDQKESFGHCYIEAPEAEAKVIFYKRFGHNPDRITCTCCGADYSIDENETLEQATGYQRGCKWRDDKYVEEPSSHAWEHYITLRDYIASDDARVIYAADIKDGERVGEIPEQGWAWVG